MTMRARRGWLLLAVLGLGCGSQTVVEPDHGPADAEPVIRLGEKTDVNLRDWLGQPRAELARQAQEWTVTLEKQQRSGGDDHESVVLLPRLHPPTNAPVFQTARFSEQAGFSLPPYLPEGSKDPAVAQHLARYGDVEAALKLADPADAELVKAIESRRAERNYPVEWTRLVGLVLQSAQFRLATGDQDAATELVLIHKQLRALLGPRAASGPLGGTLLPLGRRALTLAAAAWRDPKLKRTELAGDVEAALTARGECPAPALGLTPGASRAEVARVFQGGTGGPSAIAWAPATGRAFDLLALPVPAEGVEGILAFLDGDRLVELLVCYRSHISLTFPEPANLAHYLIDHALPARDLPPAPGLLGQAYKGAGLAYDVTLVTSGDTVGALVRVGDDRGTRARPSLPKDPRDFGIVHLDGSFEQNRLALDPGRSGEAVEVERAAALAAIKLPVTDLPPALAVLRREPGHDLPAALTLRWAPDQNPYALAKLAEPLWAAYGAARIEGVEDAEGGHLRLTWEDAQTRFTLRLPYNAVRSPEFVAEDRRGPEALPGRAEVAERFDRARRQARWEAGKPIRRLPRAPLVHQINLEGLHLGMGRAEALAALPRGQTIRRQDLPGGASLLFLTEPASPVGFWARQLFVRFGPGGRVAEVRVRYQEGPHGQEKSRPGLLGLLKKAGGEPEKQPAPWAGLWTDLPAQKPAPVLYRWQDDCTLLTYQRDAGGTEVILRDCPVDAPRGVPLPPLQFCSRGVEGCPLGDTRAAVLKRWGVSQPATADGALGLGQPDNSPYDGVWVWSEEGKVVRVVARHRARMTLQAPEVTAALQEAWSRDIDHLGTLRRQDAPSGQMLQGYGWNDDRTRVRTFGQDTEDGPRLFTEWREWPVAPKTAAPH